MTQSHQSLHTIIVNMKNAKVINSYLLSAYQRMIRIGGCAQTDQFLLCSHVILLVLSSSASLLRFRLTCKGEQQNFTIDIRFNYQLSNQYVVLLCFQCI